MSDQVAVKTEKEKDRNENKEHASEEDNCPKELDNTSTPNQKELENEVSKKKTIIQIVIIY